MGKAKHLHTGAPQKSSWTLKELTFNNSRRLSFFAAVLLLLACVFLSSCEKLPLRLPRLGVPLPSADGGTRAETLHVDRDDEELATIALDAQESLPEFFRHFLRPAKGEQNFQVKYPFRADPDSGFANEQLWLSDIHFKGGAYYGSLANNPFYAAPMKKGDIVPFYMSQITDWMYTSNGKIIGGRSIKHLIEQIPKHEQSDAQREILTLFE